MLEAIVVRHYPRALFRAAVNETKRRKFAK